ncbi:hypothetical protein [Oligoflexus tunisiensis]|uniref:hypothetical protein n=1 Tax=Oligoflexus tunisiensis TaxID=708132 RepID=UPI00114C947A|nr:hypothetical protein [Oligoflexus tunisiensis]
MKSYFGIALFFVLGAQVAHGGGIGGLGGGTGLTIHFNPTTQSIRVPGHLDARFEIARRGAGSESDYYMEPGDFARLLEVSDSRQVIIVWSEGGTRSYRAVSGDQPQQVELIDRRAAIRSEVR